MANLYDLFYADESLKNNGRWIDYEKWGVSFKIASLDSKEYKKALKDLLRSLSVGSGSLLKYRSDEQNERMLLDLFSKHIVKDWRGVTDENGEELPYSSESVKKIMTDLPELYKELYSIASDVSTFVLGKQKAAQE